MNSIWLKPLIAFAVGILLGVGVMYLVGVKPTGLTVCEGIPDVAGFSGKGLSILDDNETVISAELTVNLAGLIQEIQGDTLVVANGTTAPVTVVVKDYTSITGEPREGEEVAKFSRDDLQLYEFVQVFGRLAGDKIEADNIIRTVPPSQ